ncbi:retrotransposon protein, putative, ty1-copia subclass [Tanacetum coccineum]|uniref:Retrotransposon protein, putative, ty1-copia subclass n=1 Tax=Tanacetum coccineum TaxID=301880 RepID=A0ABQ5C2R4_9ASTR
MGRFEKKSSSYNLKKWHLKRLSSIDVKVDLGCASEEDFLNHKDSLKFLVELERLESKDLAQKAKLKWALQGDENTGFFHGMLKKKRCQLTIKGILKNGEWIEDPNLVKAEFLNHFRTRFNMATGIPSSFGAELLNPLSFINLDRKGMDIELQSFLPCQSTLKRSITSSSIVIWPKICGPYWRNGERWIFRYALILLNGMRGLTPCTSPIWSMFEISGNNFNDWFRQFKMVLRVEWKLFVIEQPISLASPTDSEYLRSGMRYMIHNENKVKGKGNDKKVYVPKPKNPKPTAMERPAKDDTYHHCKEVGHCKRNYPAYLAELIKKKKQVGTASSSDVFIIELFSFPTKSWVYDTICGTHICNTKHGIGGVRKLKQVEAIGSLDLVLTNNLVICLDNCHYAPSITRGVVSVSRLVDNGFVQCFTDYGISISKNNVLYFNAIARNGVYEIDMHDLVPNVNSMYNVSNKKAKRNLDFTYLWHCSLAHINKKRIKQLQQDGLLKSTDDESFDKCESCLSGKITKKPFPHSNERAKDILGIIHTNVCGPLRHVSRQGASYFITFTDDYSRYGYVYLLKHKHEVFETFKVFKNEVENQLGMTIKAIRSDRGGEYISQEFKDYLKANGIVQQLTPPYTPQHNGVSERRNRTLLDMVRSMMNLTTLPLSFWDYALMSATRILNMVPTKKVDKTPYKLWYEKVSNLSYLKVWECEALVKRDMPDKLEQRSVKYAEFFEKRLINQEISGRAVDLEEIQEEEDTTPFEITSNIPQEGEGFEPPQPPQEEEISIRRSKRTQSNKWIDAMNAEIQSMMDNMVWVLVDLPPGCKTVGKTFSPVADIRAIRILIKHKYIQVNGLNLHVAEIGSESSPAVIFLHGFPEIWYTWRHQMIAVAKAGYRALAPDYRGYGLSDIPSKPEKTSFLDLVKDTASILDSLNISSKEPGRAEADFGRLDAKTVVRNIYILFSKSEIPIAPENQEIMDLVEPSTPLPSWFTEDDLAVYGALYEKSGFQTALQVPYRSFAEKAEYQKQDPNELKVEAPALFIMGEKDYVFKFPGMEEYLKSGEVKNYVPNLEIIYLPEGSHFVHEQSPDEVNQLLLKFLNRNKY